MIAFGVGLAGTLGCPFTRYNEEHCAYLGGDATCQERYGDELAFCRRASCGSSQNGDGCVTSRPEDDECYSPCGAQLSFTEDATCIDEITSSSSDDSSGDETTTTTGSPADESGSTTGTPRCTDNGECTEADAPFCDPKRGECIACDGLADPNNACAELDPVTPLCIGGECVQCTAEASAACQGRTPVCDDATHTCVPCTSHGQCGEAACNLFTGTCLPTDAVVHVGPGQEFTTLSNAVDSFAAGEEGTLVVHQDDYDEAVTVDGGRVLAFLANEDDDPRWGLLGGGSPQLVVTGSMVLMEGIQVSGNSATDHPGLRVDGGFAWLDRSRVIANNGGGVLVQEDGELVVRNSFLGSTIDTNVLSVQGAAADVLYSTLGASLGSTTALTCNPAAIVTVRNSLLVSRDTTPEVTCAGVSATHTASESLLDGTGNVALGGMSTTWFTNFNGGDFHLTTAPVVLATTAQREPGDPLVDIDGDPRPEVDGATDFAGADVP